MTKSAIWLFWWLKAIAKKDVNKLANLKDAPRDGLIDQKLPKYRHCLN